MKHYEITDIKGVTIPAGIVALTVEQALCRRYGVKIQKNGTYLVTVPIQFKAGEVFGYDGDLPKGMANCLTPVDETAGPKKSGRQKKI